MLAFPHLLMSRNPLTYADLVSLVELLMGVFVLLSSLGEAILIRGMGLEGGGTLITTKIPLPISNEPFVLGRRKNVAGRATRGRFCFPRLHYLEQRRLPTPVSTPSCSCGGPDLCKSVMGSNHRMS